MASTMLLLVIFALSLHAVASEGVVRSEIRRLAVDSDGQYIQMASVDCNAGNNRCTSQCNVDGDCAAGRCAVWQGNIQKYKCEDSLGGLTCNSGTMCQASATAWTKTDGSCRGGKRWPNGKLWDCIWKTRGKITLQECKDACATETDCAAFETSLTPTSSSTDKGKCCLFKEGNSGNGKNRRKWCYLKPVAA
mmetsp:Transcript_50297/g.90271  ORF Transcript_50297/g.90271 Transcript_50297/m.90271 type:complete len:192 (+) Transcript_50297:192-767(+)